MSGWFQVPKSVPNKADAFHSFNKRRKDGFGGFITQGQTPPEEWKGFINVTKGGINKALSKFKEKMGKPAEVRLLEFTLLDFTNWRCDWTAYIGESSDGKHKTNVGTAGGIGIGGNLKPENIAWDKHPGTNGSINLAAGLKKGNWKPVPIKVKVVKGITDGKQYEKAQGGAIEIVNGSGQLQLRQFFYQSDAEIY
jgi:hypothetical protein